MIPDAQIKRLREAMKCSYAKMASFRENRYRAIEQFLGSHYSANGTKQKVPINLLAMAIGIYCRQLAAKNPKVLVSTQHMELKPRAEMLELAGDHLLDEIGFQKTIRSMVLNALFSVAIAKIGITADSQVEIDGVWHDSGQPFVDSIDLDDIVFDMSSTTFEHQGFIGNKYFQPLEVIKSSGLYNPEVVAKIKATAVGDESQVFETNGTEVKKLSQGEAKEEDDYEDRVLLVDVYLPRRNVMLTLVANQPELPPLNEIEWEGPEAGPYRILSFQEVPNNIMPLPPVAIWRDLHELVNHLFNKVGRQAERQKTVGLIQVGKDQDAKAIRDSSDGDIIAVENPKNFSEFSTRGAEPTGIALTLQAQDIFSRMAGNLDSIGGLSPQADTLGQEELLSQSASKTVAEMQDRTMEVAKAIIHDLLWYLWHDPLISIPLTQHVAGVEIPIEFTPEDREGDFYEYNITVQPYSMEEQTPAKKLTAIAQIWERFIMPGLPLLQAQGMAPNMEGLLKNIAKLTNIKELNELLIFMRPPEATAPTPPVGTPTQGKPAQTKRTYERVSRPGSSNEGKSNIMQVALMGGKPQGAEMDSLTRPSV
jgi:hypothetical protein